MKDLIITIFTDGGSRGNPGPAAAAFVVIDSEGNLIDQQGFYLGQATNNQAEYCAVEKAMKWLLANKDKLENTKVVFKLDSLLVVNQMFGSYKIRDSVLQQKAQNIKMMIKKLGFICNFSHIPRIQNKLADALVNRTLDEQ